MDDLLKGNGFSVGIFFLFRISTIQFRFWMNNQKCLNLKSCLFSMRCRNSAQKFLFFFSFTNGTQQQQKISIRSKQKHFMSHCWTKIKTLRDVVVAFFLCVISLNTFRLIGALMIPHLPDCDLFWMKHERLFVSTMHEIRCKKKKWKTAVEWGKIKITKSSSSSRKKIAYEKKKKRKSSRLVKIIHAMLFQLDK